MRFLKIQNKGLLDARLISLIGGTTKDNDPYKIGQWGSGLKYTIPYLLKNNIDFKIFIGEREVKVETRPETIRDETFHVIWIDGRETSITTKMGGQEWKPWMIIREIWCNALDEGEAYREVTDICVGRPDKTTIFVQLDKDFQNVLDNWTDYFIHDQDPLFESRDFKIYAGGDALRLYKQGILIREDKTHKGLFSYDIRNADINELREYSGSTEYPIVGALAHTNANVITFFIENVTDAHFEGQMNYEWFTRFGQIWRDTLGNAKIIHQKAVDNIVARGSEMDMAGIIVLPEMVYKFLSKQFEGIGALRTADKINEFYEIHSEALSERLNQAFAILECCEYSIHPELKFIFGAFGDKNKQGQINVDTKEIYLSDSLLEKSMFNFITVLVEENEHFRTEFMDCSRPFQQHFINLFTKTLLDKAKVEL